MEIVFHFETPPKFALLVSYFFPKLKVKPFADTVQLLEPTLCDTKTKKMIVFGNYTIAKHLARLGKKARDLFGDYLTQIDQWLEVTSSTEPIQSYFSLLNNYLQLRTYFIGNTVTLADLAIFVNCLKVNKQLQNSKFVHLKRWFNHMSMIPQCKRLIDLKPFSCKKQRQQSMNYPKQMKLVGGGSERDKQQKGDQNKNKENRTNQEKNPNESLSIKDQKNNEIQVSVNTIIDSLEKLQKYLNIFNNFFGGTHMNQIDLFVFVHIKEFKHLIRDNTNLSNLEIWLKDMFLLPQIQNYENYPLFKNPNQNKKFGTLNEKIKDKKKLKKYLKNIFINLYTYSVENYQEPTETSITQFFFNKLSKLLVGKERCVAITLKNGTVYFSSNSQTKKTNNFVGVIEHILKETKTNTFEIQTHITIPNEKGEEINKIKITHINAKKENNKILIEKSSRNIDILITQEDHNFTELLDLEITLELDAEYVLQQTDIIIKRNKICSHDLMRKLSNLILHLFDCLKIVVECKKNNICLSKMERKNICLLNMKRKNFLDPLIMQIYSRSDFNKLNAEKYILNNDLEKLTDEINKIFEDFLVKDKIELGDYKFNEEHKKIIISFFTSLREIEKIIKENIFQEDFFFVLNFILSATYLLHRCEKISQEIKEIRNYKIKKLEDIINKKDKNNDSEDQDIQKKATIKETKIKIVWKPYKLTFFGNQNGIHAEMVIFNQLGKLDFISISKQCCPQCYYFLNKNSIKNTGCHGKIIGKWKIDQKISEKILDKKTLDEITKIYNDFTSKTEEKDKEEEKQVEKEKQEEKEKEEEEEEKEEKEKQEKLEEKEKQEIKTIQNYNNTIQDLISNTQENEEIKIEKEKEKKKNIKKRKYNEISKETTNETIYKIFRLNDPKNKMKIGSKIERKRKRNRKRKKKRRNRKRRKTRRKRKTRN
ncbi:eukaryotic translation elongation factor 1 epsilon-1 [Anaeramoeba flamelloides]|uniref:Eukaryotic translation elongation factor 1 epsilon-1 n=1 Tax=Anaeramoeba flamelloides TaxID=1746091 RepID=A0AAV8ABA7_9EUKA|nr:eukaryotic translation elongation factor 1 epsilon-1 [Anaeramoeba flamelloides]